jgi:hypothetical protein
MCFFTIIRTNPPLTQCRWMVLFELQHTLPLLHIRKVRHFYGRLQRTNQWWPRVLDFKRHKTWNVDKRSVTNCCDITIRLVTLNFQIYIPYSVTPCINCIWAALNPIIVSSSCLSSLILILRYVVGVWHTPLVRLYCHSGLFSAFMENK